MEEKRKGISIPIFIIVIIIFLILGLAGGVFLSKEYLNKEDKKTITEKTTNETSKVVNETLNEEKEYAIYKNENTLGINVGIVYKDGTIKKYEDISYDIASLEPNIFDYENGILYTINDNILNMTTLTTKETKIFTTKKLNNDHFNGIYIHNNIFYGKTFKNKLYIVDLTTKETKILESKFNLIIDKKNEKAFYLNNNKLFINNLSFTDEKEINIDNQLISDITKQNNYLIIGTGNNGEQYYSYNIDNKTITKYENTITKENNLYIINDKSYIYSKIDSQDNNNLILKENGTETILLKEKFLEQFMYYLSKTEVILLKYKDDTDTGIINIIDLKTKKINNIENDSIFNNVFNADYHYIN